ncbi:hypothetical protein [uncultured Vagococcus sp.]|uniref:hypothetical protein n=1 Tax=uncultured Vagococcus sp. TaxID=189676 RepID=UPI002590E46C|nr:hypothetical protein [uncultured Vagococcus sp.]
MTSKKNRRHLYFNQTEMSQTALTYLDELSEKYPTKNPTELLGEVFREYETLKAVKIKNSELAIDLADQVVKRLRPMFLRAGNADKNSRILIELMNGMMFKEQYNDTIVLTDELTTSPVKKATRKVERDIESVIKRNTEVKVDSSPTT